MSRSLSIALMLGLACASGPVPVAQQPIDWQAANDRWSLHIVTLDPDGDERVTRIWLATLDGVGTIRTGGTRWRKNLERDPSCRIRVLGIDYPVSVEFVADHAEKARIDDAFVEKYGFLERVLFRQERGETHEIYARLR